MKKYQLAWTDIPGDFADEIKLHSTNPKLLQWFLLELKKIVPNYKLVNDGKNPFWQDYVDFDLNDNQVYCKVTKLGDKGKRISYWLSTELMQMGWEPFNISQYGGMSQQIWYRLEITE